MTSNLTGLASLAMAMAHLEEVSEVHSISPTSISGNSHTGETKTSPEFHSPVSNGIPIPARRSFHRGAPRVVSIDSDDLLKNDDEVDDIEIFFDNPSEPTPPAPSSTEVITKVEDADVLCGRGGETNNHAGNIQYRNLVKKYQRLYLKAKRRDKPKIAHHIVDTIRRKHGRFLKKDAPSNTWRDVGNSKAREKTSQALREGAPDIRDCDSDLQFPSEPTQQARIQGGQSGKIPLIDVGGKKRKCTPILPNMANLVSPTPSSGYFQESYISPVMFPVTVSADDDERPHPHPWDKPYISMNKKTVRGPRLAILKARLMSEDGQVVS